MIWRYAIRYKGTIAGAGLALLVAAGATLAIPDGFRRVIDKGFTAGGGDDRAAFQLSVRDGGRARARHRLAASISSRCSASG